MIDRYGPDIILELGLAPSRRKLKLEKRARNVQYAKTPDNDGFKPRGGRILARGPDVYDSTMDMDYLNTVLNEEGVPARLSNDAERYVCNRAYYESLDHIHRIGANTKAGLIHMPWTTKYADQVNGREGKPMEEKDIQRAVSLVFKNV